MLVRVPAEHERRSQQCELRGGLVHGGQVAERPEQRHGILHGRGVDLLEAEEEVAVSADEELAGEELNVFKGDARPDLVDVEGELRARDGAVTSIGAIRSGRHQLRAPTHEHETIRVRDLGRARVLVDDDCSAELKRNGHPPQID